MTVKKGTNFEKEEIENLKKQFFLLYTTKGRKLLGFSALLTLSYHGKHLFLSLLILFCFEIGLRCVLEMGIIAKSSNLIF